MTRVNQVVEFLKRVGFEQDVEDLKELGVEGVLYKHGIVMDFNPEEIEQLQADLLPLAAENQTREIRRTVTYVEVM